MYNQQKFTKHLHFGEDIIAKIKDEDFDLASNGSNRSSRIFGIPIINAMTPSTSKDDQKEDKDEGLRTSPMFNPNRTNYPYNKNINDDDNDMDVDDIIIND